LDGRWGQGQGQFYLEFWLEWRYGELVAV
jgi:hypothetical protein